MDIDAKRALARIFEAWVDLKAAETLLEEGIESRALFHAQQCVEKSMKACLSKVIIGELRSHKVVPYFKEKILPKLPTEIKEKFEKLDDIIWVEERWIDTRYEEIRGKKIKIPSLSFGFEDARKGVEVARKVILDCIDIVNYIFKLNVPKDYKKIKDMIGKEE